MAGETDLKHALAPLREGARQGLDVVCLSPACCRVVAAHLAAEPGPDASDGEAAPDAAAPHVRDLAHVLAQADGLERLARAVRTPLAPLRIALHGACHADHWPPAPATPGMGSEQPAAAETEAQQTATAGTVLPPGARGQYTLLERAAHWALSSRGSAPALAQAAESCTEDAENTALATLLATAGATPLPDVSVSGGCGAVRVQPANDGREARAAEAGAVRCLALAAEAGADLLVAPCYLCCGDLNRYQRHLDPNDPARTVPVLHLAQVLGVACGVAPLRLDLTRTTASARRALAPFMA